MKGAGVTRQDAATAIRGRGRVRNARQAGVSVTTAATIKTECVVLGPRTCVQWGGY